MTVGAPRPAAVPWNDWSQAPVSPPAAFAPAEAVTVVVPYYQSHAEALPKTLAALEAQSYPRGLFEVVVVDDGSDPPLALSRRPPFQTRIVHQDRQGFGLARARNAGARAASHDILLFLDSDVLAGPGWIAAHARWHHAVSDALTLGATSYVRTTDISAGAVRGAGEALAGLLGDRAADPPRAEGLLRRTNALRSKDDAVFMAIAGNNFGVRKAFYEELGGSDESFARWGYEDTEFAYRAHVRGGLIVPVRGAHAWHQGRWEEERNRRGSRLQHEKAAQLIAHRLFRGRRRGRVFAVPEFVVTLAAGDQEAERTVEAAALLLADRAHDLVVRIVVRDESGDGRAARLSEAFGCDPRVLISAGGNPLDDFPASPFHVSLPSGVEFARDVVHRLRTRIGGVAVARARLPGGGVVEIARAWALHRARRRGACPEEFGGLRSLPARALRIRVAARGRERPARSWGEPHPKRSRLADSLRLVEGPAEARTWFAWIGYRCRRAGRGAWERLRRKAGHVAESIDWRTGDGPGRAAALASAVATVFWRAANRRRLLAWHAAHAGRRARAGVAGAWGALAGSRDAPAGRRRTSDGGAECAEGGMRRPGDAGPRLVPPFDLRVWNPIRWRRTGGGRVGALGPAGRLPAGVHAHCAVRPGDLFGLRGLHHVKDMAAFHADEQRRAATLARVAATGALVHLVDGGPRLGPLLGKELRALMAQDPSRLDAAGREARSIQVRRIALRRHSSFVRAERRGPAGTAGQDPRSGRRAASALPVVSVLLATRRPELLPQAVDAVARQTYPRIELVLALHGSGFGDPGRAVAGVGRPAKTLRMPAREPLGAVLDAATAASSGDLLAKMDDDDAYGPNHVWDLVLARAYSRAQLVGKGLEFVYLAGRDVTVHLHAGRGEDYRTMTLAGGAMLISRRDLERAGGWPPARRGVDKALVERVLRTRGAVYRTHGSEYVMVRRPDGHTWATPDDYFLDKAEASAPGWRPEMAGLPADSRSPGANGRGKRRPPVL